MSIPLDYQPPSGTPRFPRFRKILKVLIILPLYLGAAVLLFGLLLGLLMMLAFHGTSKSIPPPDVAHTVAESLMGWGVCGAVPDRDPEHVKLENSIVQRIKGIQGYTESDGFHGDGTDWYEVDLSPALAAELRTRLGQSSAIKKSKRFPRENAEPSWWPKTWPANAQCYEKGLQYFVLPDTGTRAWFMQMRT
jgi:hypothetical protein